MEAGGRGLEAGGRGVEAGGRRGWAGGREGWARDRGEALTAVHKVTARRRKVVTGGHAVWAGGWGVLTQGCEYWATLAGSCERRGVPAGGREGAACAAETAGTVGD